ncbi:type I restriction enzyme HsdR N-terminal domain-containing protein [Soonwooa sp.]|uniref:type I restriction enzyme HsdR N-terminal domain-containing protein n=1 Tax=Soonwooa sp. TaxID=1938592 RepID=UPI0035B0E55C
MQLPKLNFNTEFDLKIKQDKDTFFIYDSVRKMWLVLTPEEWVRQHWVAYFLKIKKKNASSLILEQKLELNSTTKRLDMLVTRRTKAQILVELKAPNINLTEKQFEQIARYNSVIQAPEIILSNGLHHIYAKYLDGQYRFEAFEF